MFYKKLLSLTVLTLMLTCVFTPAHAVWIWSPNGKGWLNPKNAVKETPQLQLEHAKNFMSEDKTLPKALTEFQKLLRAYPRAFEAAEAQFYIGEIYERQNNFYLAHKAYQDVVDKYPFSERGAQVAKRQYVMANHLLEGGIAQRGKLASAFMGIKEDVVEMFQGVIKNDPYGELAPKSQYKIGLYYKENQMYTEAREAFEKTVNDYPGTEWAKSAVFQIAQVDAIRSSEAQYEQKVTKEAVDAFKDFVQEFPESELTDDAKEHIKELREKEAENAYVVAEFYEKQKNTKAAKIYYQDVADTYADTSWGEKALKKIQEL